MKRLAIGLSDFKHLIEEDFYYFDKTKFIEEVIKDGSQVKLFARPRRFGKTLNMSMLKYFFDIKNREENKKIFKGLYIEKTEAFKEQGQYPVIFYTISFLITCCFTIMLFFNIISFSLKPTFSNTFITSKPKGWIWPFILVSPIRIAQNLSFLRTL